MKFYQKLVRDHIPEIIHKNGQLATVKYLTAAEFEDALKKKLSEEIAEFNESHSKEEMADILEVLYSMIKSYGWSLEEVEQIRIEKANERGSFDNKVYLISVKDNDE